MMNRPLTYSEQRIAAAALRVAAAQYAIDAQHNINVQRLVEQFQRQAKEANDLAALLED